CALVSRRCFFFFFQAEDGIRDLYVTGVQTCALPICFHLKILAVFAGTVAALAVIAALGAELGMEAIVDERVRVRAGEDVNRAAEIGRASCRERVEIAVVDVTLKKKREGGLKRAEASV